MRFLNWLLRRKPQSAEAANRICEQNDRYAMEVAMRAWTTGKAQLGTVDKDGKLTITEIEDTNDH